MHRCIVYRCLVKLSPTEGMPIILAFSQDGCSARIPRLADLSVIFLQVCQYSINRNTPDVTITYPDGHSKTAKLGWDDIRQAGSR